MRCPTRSTCPVIQQSSLLNSDGRNSVVQPDDQLLWRISDTYFAKGQLEECLSWANLAYHEVIRQFNSNDAKILRFVLPRYANADVLHGVLLTSKEQVKLAINWTRYPKHRLMH